MKLHGPDDLCIHISYMNKSSYKYIYIYYTDYQYICKLSLFENLGQNARRLSRILTSGWYWLRHLLTWNFWCSYRSLSITEVLLVRRWGWQTADLEPPLEVKRLGGRSFFKKCMYIYIYIMLFYFLWPPLRSLRRDTECRAHGEKRASWCIPQSRVWSSWRILCLKLQLLSNAQHMNRLNSETNRQNALCMRRILQSARL